METQVKNGGEGLGLKTDRRFMTDALTALLEEGETLYSPVYGCLMERELFRAANHFGFFGRTDTHLLIAILNPFNGKRIDWTARVPLSVRKATLRRGDHEKALAFAVTADGRAVGSIGIFRQENIHFRTAEIGYYIAEPYWGQGLGTAAVGLACRAAFESTDLLRIFAEPFADNIASCRVLEKNGFRCEGTLRSNAVKDGRVRDMKMYSLLRTDRIGG